MRLLDQERRYQKHILSQYCGSHSGELVLMLMAEEFINATNDHPREAITVRPNATYYRGRKTSPPRVKDGSGALWLKIFSKYTGDECLLFPFATAATPRGVVTYNFKSMPAHRAMCTMVNKLPPEDKPLALHRCGNGHLGCVTPKHLYWGDTSDNNRDAHRHMIEGKPSAVVDVERLKKPRHKKIFRGVEQPGSSSGP